MNLPAYDTEVVITLRANAPLLVNETPTALADLTQTIEEAATGKRAKVEVFVWPPLDHVPEFVDHVRAVQAEVRRAQKPVFIGYHSMEAERAL